MPYKIIYHGKAGNAEEKAEQFWDACEYVAGNLLPDESGLFQKREADEKETRKGRYWAKLNYYLTDTIVAFIRVSERFDRAYFWVRGTPNERLEEICDMLTKAMTQPAEEADHE